MRRGVCFAKLLSPAHVLIRPHALLPHEDSTQPIYTQGSRVRGGTEERPHRKNRVGAPSGRRTRLIGEEG